MLVVFKVLCSKLKLKHPHKKYNSQRKATVYKCPGSALYYIIPLKHPMEAIKKMYMSAVGSEKVVESVDAVEQYGATGPPPPLSPSASMTGVDPGARDRYVAMKRARVPDEEIGSEVNAGNTDEAAHRMKQAKRLATAKKNKKKANKHLIQKTTFKAIMNELIGPEMTVSAEACRILHGESERYLSSIFENAQVLSRLNGRKTLSLADFHGVLALQSPSFTDKVALLRKSHSFMERPEQGPGEAVQSDSEDADEEHEEEEGQVCSESSDSQSDKTENAPIN